MKHTVLVTGGAGYIGSHTAVELIGAGFDVVIVDNLSNSTLAAVEGVRRITGVEVPFVEADCTDAAAMGEIFGRWNFAAAIHFAAFKAVGESIERPLMYYRNNVGSFIALLEMAVAHGVEGVVFSSSATVYGQPDALPVTELSPRKPATSPYGASKQICEDILRDTVISSDLRGRNAGGGLGYAKKLRGIALRYFNPVGAHRSGLIGELPRGVPGNILPFIAQTAAGIRSELLVFGGDYATPDGTALRDYIDVVDLARAHVVAVQRIIGGGQRSDYEVFNIGTGRPVSVLELVRGFERASGERVPFRIVDRRAGDVEAVWADTSLAASELGWRSECSLDETLSSAWAWQKSASDLPNPS
ncbi:MAG: UDP-glucose 4-epimerase GalE [Alistipes sp.]|jgi:UDP-glucose 4-epimerase|nr:UDP-glucose 4-epimerase GalE [Alistipes sp.]